MVVSITVRLAVKLSWHDALHLAAPWVCLRYLVRVSLMGRVNVRVHADS